MTHDEMVAYYNTHAVVQQAWLQFLPLIAMAADKIFSSLSNNRAQARVAETGLNNQQDRLAIDRAESAQNNARQNVQTDTTYRETQRKNAIKSAYLKGVRDYHVTRPTGVPDGRAVGGARPSAITGKEALADEFGTDAMNRYRAGAPGLDTPTPGLTPVPEANGWDKFFNVMRGISGAASIASQFIPTGNADAGGGTLLSPDKLSNVFQGSTDWGSTTPVNTPMPDGSDMFKPRKLSNVFGGR